MNKINDEIDKLTLWLKEQAVKSPYSELSIKLVIHSNSIRRTEKGIVEKQISNI